MRSGCNAGCGRFCHFPSCFWHLVARMVKIRRVRKELNLSIDSHTADVHVGVSLNGGTPHFTPQIMIIFSRTNPIGCWGNPPFFRKPTRYEFWQSPPKKKHGNVVFPPLMDLPRSPTRPFWGRSCGIAPLSQQATFPWMKGTATGWGKIPRYTLTLP